MLLIDGIGIITSSTVEESYKILFGYEVGKTGAIAYRLIISIFLFLSAYRSFKRKPVQEVVKRDRKSVV